MDARLAAEGVDLEAGVVRDGRLARRLRDGGGLEICVFLKGGAGLLDLKIAAGLALGDQVDPNRLIFSFCVPTMSMISF